MGRRSQYREQNKIPVRGPSLTCERREKILRQLRSRLITGPFCCICLDTRSGLVNACREGGHEHPDRICEGCKAQLRKCPICREHYQDDNSDGESDYGDMPPLIEIDIDDYEYHQENEEITEQLIVLIDREWGSTYYPITSPYYDSSSFFSYGI